LQKARFIKLILFNTLFSLRAGTQQSPTTNARMKSRPAVKGSPAFPTEPRLLSTSSKDDGGMSGTFFFFSFFISFFELNIFLHVHSFMGFQGPNAQVNHVICQRRQKRMPPRLVFFFLVFCTSFLKVILCSLSLIHVSAGSNGPNQPRLLSTSSTDDGGTSGTFFSFFFISFFKLNIFIHVHLFMGFQGPNAQLNHVICQRRQKMMPPRLVFFFSFFVLHF
jgi:hypothetical protein